MTRDKIKKILEWRPAPGLVAVGAVAALILLLIPLLRMTLYAVPWYDDYSYGIYAKRALEQEHTFRSALKGAYECTRMSWYAWQGTYMSILFMSLTPSVWGEEYYLWGPIFLILILLFAVALFVGVLSRKILRAGWPHTVILQAVTAGMVLALIHTPQQGFYWYNAGVHYVGMHSFFLIFVAVMVLIFYEKKFWQRMAAAILGLLLSAMVAGGNFVTTLQGLLVLVTVFVMGCVLRKRQVWWMVPMLVVYALGFCQNVKAPGNDKRAMYYIGWGMPPLKAVGYSFVEAAKHLWRFTGWMTLAILLLLLPIVWNMVRQLDFSFRFPGVVSVWSICLYATGFTPSLYSIGNAGLGRTLVAVKITLQILIVINFVYWCGWIQDFLEKKGKLYSGRMCRWWYYPLLAVLMLVIFKLEPNQIGTYSPYGAYYFVHTGEAYNFHRDFLARTELLKSGTDAITVKPYAWRPWYVCVGELSDDPESEPNRAVAEWYGRSAVICEELSEE